MDQSFCHPASAFALVLAAGFSSRMGTCKTALPWFDGRPLLSYQIEQLLLANISPIVVLGPQNVARWQGRLPGAQLVVNPQPKAGKSSSIRTGLQQLPSAWLALLIVAVDQPRPTWVYQTLMQEHQRYGALLTGPVYAGRLGHPLVFAPALFPHLMQINEPQLGLRQVVRNWQAELHRVEFGTAIVLADLNTPEDYAQARRD